MLFHSSVAKQAQNPLFFFISFKRRQKSQNKHKFHSFILFHSSVARSLKTSTKSTFFYFIQALSEFAKQAEIPLFYSIAFKRYQKRIYMLLACSLVVEVDRTHLAYNHPAKRFR